MISAQFWGARTFGWGDAIPDELLAKTDEYLVAAELAAAVRAWRCTNQIMRVSRWAWLYLTHRLICAQVIGAHTKVIQAFVDTSDSPFGCLALEKLFELADLDGDGTVDRDELERALKKLGFYHLSAKQIDAIMSRADEDDNCNARCPIRPVES